MKILVLSHYFWPEPIPKPLELAEALRDEGHTVRAVTGFPNYPEGRLYPGFPLRLFSRDSVRGIPVLRTFMYPSHGPSLLGRLVNYSSFMVSSIIGALLSGPFDVAYVWHPPLSIGVSAAAISLVRRRPFVYDVQDIWPESAMAAGVLRPGRLLRLMSRVEKFVYRHAAHILVVTPGAKANLVQKGVPNEKITVAPHWYDDAELRRVPPDARESVRSARGWRDRFVVMFAGNIGLLQGLDTVVLACRHLPETSSVLVAMVGDGVDTARLKDLCQRHGLENRVAFVPHQAASEMARLFRAADSLLVHLRASPLAPLIIPSKTVAYLAAGKPIVMASTGASADIVAQARAGVVVSPDDSRALALAMLELERTSPAELSRMGEAGRKVFEEHFTRLAALPVYFAVLERCAGIRCAGRT